MLQMSIRIDFDNRLKEIEKEFHKYTKLFNDIITSAIGKYSIDTLIQIIYDFLHFLEKSKPIIKEWVIKYFKDNRGKLWLYYGISKGNYLTDYWKMKETNFIELSNQWSFLFNRSCSEYKGYVIDLKEAQDTIISQRKRQDTINPNYEPFHPNGCTINNCCCFMLDDMEQWYDEEQKELKVSKNIFLNKDLQDEFFKIASNDLNELKHEWIIWEPEKDNNNIYISKFKIKDGLTPIKILINWIKEDFYYSPIVNMFTTYDYFNSIWNTINDVDTFIFCKKEKLKEISQLI